MCFCFCFCPTADGLNIKLELPHFHVSYTGRMSIYPDAPVATAACAKATRRVSMSTRLRYWLRVTTTVYETNRTSRKPEPKPKPKPIIFAQSTIVSLSLSLSQSDLPNQPLFSVGPLVSCTVRAKHSLEALLMVLGLVCIPLTASTRTTAVVACRYRAKIVYREAGFLSNSVP